jgi:hypothetical protein
MTKTWRERNAEARERGAYTAQDAEDVRHWASCFIGEHVQKGALQATAWADLDGTLFGLGMRAADVILGPETPDRFNEADRLLDAIEDRVLALKREGGV